MSCHAQLPILKDVAQGTPNSVLYKNKDLDAHGFNSIPSPSACLSLTLAIDKSSFFLLLKAAYNELKSVECYV